MVPALAETIDPTALDADVLERLATAGCRFELALVVDGREYRVPLWLPFWPVRHGQVARTSQSSIYRVPPAPTNILSTREWAVYSGADELFRSKNIRYWSPVPLYPGDTLHVDVEIRAADLSVNENVNKSWLEIVAGLSKFWRR